jgi:hypothetical protein
LVVFISGLSGVVIVMLCLLTMVVLGSKLAIWIEKKPESEQQAQE